MDLWEVIVIGFRRWYVSVPLLLVGIIAALQFSSGIEPVYNVDGTAAYLSPAVNVIDPDDLEPTDDPIEEILNPYAGSLRQTALTGELAAEAQNTRREFGLQGLSTNYQLAVDRRNAVIYFSVEADSPQVALDTLAALTEFVSTDLDDRQGEIGVDSRERVRLDVLPLPDEAVADYTSKSRTRYILLALAGIIAFGGAVAVESLIGHLRRRRGEDEGSAAGVEGWPAGMLVQVPPGWTPPYPRPLPEPDVTSADDREFDGLAADDDDEVVRRPGSRWRRVEG